MFLGSKLYCNNVFPLWKSPHQQQHIWLSYRISPIPLNSWQYIFPRRMVYWMDDSDKAIPDAYGVFTCKWRQNNAREWFLFFFFWAYQEKNSQVDLKYDSRGLHILQFQWFLQLLIFCDWMSMEHKLICHIKHSQTSNLNLL